LSPEVKKRKLQKLIQYLNDLKKHENSSFDQFMQNHYEVERIIQLLIESSSDLIFHELSKHNVTPDSYREAFILAGKKDILPEELANSLALATGMRNILVHEYETIDYKLVHKSIKTALRDFAEFLKALSE
jgi:uncharacterized protein YutE (UPF0331/DUF86 family)